MNQAVYHASQRRRNRRRIRPLPLLILLLVALLLAAAVHFTQRSDRDELPPAAQIPENWALILVNPWHSVPEDYGIELTQLSNGQSIDGRIYPDLQAMFDAARSQGIDPVLVSGYRTQEKQQSLMDQQIENIWLRDTPGLRPRN